MTGFVCETCGEPLVYRGGPHKPRWCAKHREAGRTRAAAESHRRSRQAIAPTNPPVHCDGCGTRLLEPSDDGLCGFCQAELAEHAAGIGAAA